MNDESKSVLDSLDRLIEKAKHLSTDEYLKLIEESKTKTDPSGNILPFRLEFDGYWADITHSKHDGYTGRLTGKTINNFVAFNAKNSSVLAEMFQDAVIYQKKLEASANKPENFLTMFRKETTAKDYLEYCKKIKEYETLHSTSSNNVECLDCNRMQLLCDAYKGTNDNLSDLAKSNWWHDIALLVLVLFIIFLLSITSGLLKFLKEGRELGYIDKTKIEWVKTNIPPTIKVAP